MISANQLIELFNQGLGSRYQTRLIRGTDEPLYLPADEYCPYHRIYFAHGYLSSALHELAHWCQAGPGRRTLVDYGYWYEPDGRNAAQQAEFERVEAQPQAIEWMLCQALGKPFQVSADNLALAVDRAGFTARVYEALVAYYHRGLPPRAAALMADLAQHQARSMPVLADYQWSR